MSAQPVSDRRRGWCPGVRRPMATGDGLLVRLHPFGGRLTADQARLVAEAARAHRQRPSRHHRPRQPADPRRERRDLSRPARPPRSARAWPSRERRRPAPAHRRSPRSPGSIRDDRFDALGSGAGDRGRAVPLSTGCLRKFFVAVDGGGSMPLDAIGADLHLTAAAERRCRLRLPLRPTDLHWIGDGAPWPVRRCRRMRSSHGFADMRRTGTNGRRGVFATLSLHLVAELAASAGLACAAVPSHRTASRSPCGRHLRHGRAMPSSSRLPFGRCSSGAAGTGRRAGASASATARSACPSPAASCCRALRTSMCRRCLRRPPAPASSPRRTIPACR